MSPSPTSRAVPPKTQGGHGPCGVFASTVAAPKQPSTHCQVVMSIARLRLFVTRTDSAGCRHPLAKALRRGRDGAEAFDTRTRMPAVTGATGRRSGDAAHWSSRCPRARCPSKPRLRVGMRRSGVSASVLCVFALLLCASSQAGTMAENGLGLVAGPVVVPGRTGVGSLGLLRLTSPTAPVDVWFFAIPRTGAPGAAAAEPLESRAVTFEPSEATLLPTVPKDVRITVLPLERPGTYVASVRVLYRIHVDPPEPGTVATTPATPAPAWFELVVDLTVRVDDAPSLKLVSAGLRSPSVRRSTKAGQLQSLIRSGESIR